jgi:hypothetical protein
MRINQFSLHMKFLTLPLISGNGILIRLMGVHSFDFSVRQIWRDFAEFMVKNSTRHNVHFC